MALKGLSFYIMVYFMGRFFDPKTIYINKYFSYIILLTIAAGAILLVEVAAQSPLQFHSGYFDYSYYFFNLDSSGAYGLQTSFTSDSGYIRFGSFFTNPLEHATATLLALAVIAGLYTRDDNKLNINGIGLLALGATFLSILFALSRAPLASYFIMIYVYALVTKRKMIVNAIQTLLGLSAVYIAYLFYQFENNHSGIIAVILNTIDFSDPSSVGHLLAWVEGIASIIQYPFGLGLGSSGRVGATLDQNIGGENQFIIIGVQAGIIAMVLYLLVYVMFIKTSLKWLPLLKGKERKVCMTVFLIKIGLLISTLTSEIESSTYLSYMNWFLSGLLINMIMQVKTAPAPKPELAEAHVY
ncbi:MAG: O-antigen ligase family protein [Mucilaginibacter sp.]|uniref:O-antigen ligase family protein n=1 Tax=Mucilaginibacter sp. TaxID=1882438 RepID=UPI0034E42348